MTEREILIKIIKLQSALGVGNPKSVEMLNDFLEGKDLPEKTKKKYDGISDDYAKKIIIDSQNNGIEILPITSDKFPECLRNIFAPPIILFIKGKMPDFRSLPSVAVVGPRKVSEYGKKSAYSIAMRLSKAGFTIVSGAAVGADTAALNGALNGKGTPVAILGCGICYDYLPENRALRNKIAERGCLISEYPPFAPTSRYGFPIRNRIMAGISLGTVVVEAGEKSGALITAKYAVEQGKDVFVIPGNPSDEKYKGSNALLRDGAVPLLDASDIFNVYLSDFADKIDLENAFKKNDNKKTQKVQKNLISGLSKNATLLYNIIINKKYIKFSADDMLISELSGDEILSALTELEFSGLVKSLPGGYYKVP